MKHPVTGQYYETIDIQRDIDYYKRVYPKVYETKWLFSCSIVQMLLDHIKELEGQSNKWWKSLSPQQQKLVESSFKNYDWEDYP